MHPAYSVIFFTTASGAGYGLLFWLGVGALMGAFPSGDSGWMQWVALTLALALITAGLLSSTFHLGHPERAWRAFSQWRSSWLSREGVVAVATYVPAGMLWLVWSADGPAILAALLGLLAAMGAAATVYCTGMIYASLPTIRQWHRSDVPLIYLALASATGALLFALMWGLFNANLPVWLVVAALLSFVAAAILKLRYWQAIDSDPGRFTVEQATKLGGLGTVRPLDPPHTMPNFVMREMGYSVARRHARKLRMVAMTAVMLIPVLTLILSTVFAPAFVVFIGVISAAAGVFAERWLFFAEAEHVSMLYYGKSRA